MKHKWNIDKMENIISNLEISHPINSIKWNLKIDIENMFEIDIIDIIDISRLEKLVEI